MPRQTRFAQPVKATKVPAGPDWIHEVKQDGYRLMVIREGKRVQLLSKNGIDWTKRYPWIADSALRIKSEQFILDGEAVLLDVRGIGNFAGLHSRKHDDEVQFYAFDVLARDCNELRMLPLSLRKTNLAELLKRRSDGIHMAPFEQGEIGPELFREACVMGLEGLVSKHVGRAYKIGRCDHWLKNKNPNHPAYRRVQDQF